MTVEGVVMSFTSYHLVAAMADEHAKDLHREAGDARLARAASPQRASRAWSASSTLAPIVTWAAGVRAGLRPRATVSVVGHGAAECCA
jgi:hypothetical protein